MAYSKPKFTHSIIPLTKKYRDNPRIVWQAYGNEYDAQPSWIKIAEIVGDEDDPTDILLTAAAYHSIELECALADLEEVEDFLGIE